MYRLILKLCYKLHAVYSRYFVLQNQKNVPISKTCRIYKRKKLLSEFLLDESKNDRHDVICKECNGDNGENDLLFLMIYYNYDHFSRVSMNERR
jgi:hypothetical protein